MGDFGESVFEVISTPGAVSPGEHLFATGPVYRQRHAEAEGTLKKEILPVVVADKVDDIMSKQASVTGMYGDHIDEYDNNGAKP